MSEAVVDGTTGSKKIHELAWRAGGTSTHDGVRHLRIHFPRGIILREKASEQRPKRSKEEKVAVRKGRTPSTPRKPRRRRWRSRAKKQRRREEGEEQQELREYLLLLERRDGSLPPGAECVNSTKRAHRCSSCGSPGHPAIKCAGKK